MNRPSVKRRWFAVTPPNGKAGSDRMAAFTMIDVNPGVSSAALSEQWDRPTLLGPVLRDLEHRKHIRSELEC